MEQKSSEHFAEEIMITPVLSAKVGTTVKDAVSLMVKNDTGCLVVIEEQTAVGIVTERDILNKITAEGVNPSKVLVEDIMSTPLVVVHTNSPISEIAERMNTYHVRRTVVIDEKGRLAGIVGAEDLAKWLAKENNYSDATLNAIARVKEVGHRGPYG
jgi:CBS domain-containing protein